MNESLVKLRPAQSTREPRDPALQQALDWFTRLQADDVTDAEREAFAAWLNTDPAHARAYERIAGLWQDPELTAALQRHARTGQRSHTEQDSTGRGSRAALLAAAMLLLVAGLALFRVDIALRADHATGTGESRQYTLADGSTLILNTASAVTVEFDADERHIELLQGEAYFEVRSEAARPFTVDAGPARVRVTGTAFAVRDTGAGQQVAVREGQVEVTGRHGVPVTLTGGQALAIERGRLQEIQTLRADHRLAWLDGRLIFRDRPLAAVVAELDRYHPGLILVTGEALRNRAVSGNYRIDDPPAAAAALAKAVGADLTHVSDYLIILR